MTLENRQADNSDFSRLFPQRAQFSSKGEIRMNLTVESTALIERYCPYHSFKALNVYYIVLSAEFWLTFMPRSQGSALYLSYQQHSDSLSRLLSNYIVGKISWVNTEGKVYFGHRSADWCTLERREKKGLNDITAQKEKVSNVDTLHSSRAKIYFLLILLKLYSVSGRFTVTWPSWFWLPSSIHWPNLTGVFSPSQYISCWYTCLSLLLAQIDKCVKS